MYSGSFYVHLKPPNSGVTKHDMTMGKENRKRGEVYEGITRSIYPLFRLGHQTPTPAKSEFRSAREGFLTVFLGEQIKIEEILESEGNQQDADDKFNRVDIKAKNTKGDIIIIEIQNTRSFIIWNVCSIAWRRPSPSIFIWGRTIPG